MSINISNYTFNGPYFSTDELEESSGIYAIICQKYDKNYFIFSSLIKFFYIKHLSRKYGGFL